MMCPRADREHAALRWPYQAGERGTTTTLVELSTERGNTPCIMRRLSQCLAKKKRFSESRHASQSLVLQMCEDVVLINRWRLKHLHFHDWLSGMVTRDHHYERIYEPYEWAVRSRRKRGQRYDMDSACPLIRLRSRGKVEYKSVLTTSHRGKLHRGGMSNPGTCPTCSSHTNCYVNDMGSPQRL